MRTSARLLLAAALGGAALLPAPSANAMYCGPAQVACSALCGTVIGYCVL
jgi:hypothetical protein